MSRPLYHYLVGYRTLATHAASAATLLELCRRFSFAYNNFSNLPDGGISLDFPLSVAREVEREAERCGIPLTVCREGGLPRRLLRLVRRPGLVVGALAGIFLYIAATSVVWDIRISGNTTVSDRAIEDTLSACGFTVGTPLRGFHADVIENRVLLADDRLSWISINRRGTVAYVEVREAAHTPPPDTDAPADIVASVGGVVERVELVAGNVLVTAGQAVSPGELLVSGLYDSNRFGVLWTRADAKVFARTTRVITVEIPLAYEQKVYETGEGGTLSGICQEKNVIFFGNHIKFSKKTGNMGVLCDTIEREEILSPIRDVGFPISVRTVWYLPYTVKTATRTYAEAEELAYVELARRISALPGGAEVLKKTVTTSRTPEAFVLTCTLISVEDIGQVRPIEIGEAQT